jgi:hypothetical protein
MDDLKTCELVKNDDGARVGKRTLTFSLLKLAVHTAKRPVHSVHTVVNRRKRKAVTVNTSLACPVYLKRNVRCVQHARTVINGNISDIVKREVDCSYSCDMCTARFKHDADLERHRRTAHKRDRRRPHAATQHECPTCNRVCANEKKLQKHCRRVHRDHQPYKCSQCDSRFASAWYRATHEKTHAKSNHQFTLQGRASRFTAEQCTADDTAAKLPQSESEKEETFTDNCHSVARPFKCSQCDADFRNSHHRQRHERAVHAVDAVTLVRTTGNPTMRTAVGTRRSGAWTRHAHPCRTCSRVSASSAQTQT